MVEDCVNYSWLVQELEQWCSVYQVTLQLQYNFKKKKKKGMWGLAKQG